jgi:hypothetical protein
MINAEDNELHKMLETKKNHETPAPSGAASLRGF